MAFDSVPWIIDGTTIDGEVIRRAVGSLIGPAGGIVTPGDLTVSQQGTPNMSVAIGVGEIWVPGTSTASQGPYYGRNGASSTVPISASSSSNPRIDTIIAQVEDAAYAGSAKDMIPAVVVGTPTAGATLVNLNGHGAVPASSLVLAYVLVPTSATSIVTADIKNVAGLLVVGRPSPWVALVLTAGVTDFSGGTRVPSVRRNGDVVEFKGAVNTAGGAVAINTQFASIPGSALPYLAPNASAYPTATNTALQILPTGEILTTSGMAGASVFGLDNVSYVIA